MGKKDLRRKSHKARAARYPDKDLDAWWYEENGGISVYVQAEPTILVKIPWRPIRNALKRKDK